MLRKEKSDFSTDALRAILVGLFLVFPVAYSITWITGLQEKAAQDMQYEK
jgi:hypothetical protein